MYQVPEIIKQEKFIMNGCVHNEFVGLRNRYLKHGDNTFQLDLNLLWDCVKELALLLKPHYHGPCTLAEFFDNKGGKLAKRYNDACDKILESGFDLKKCSKVSAFVKNELYDELKPPRMIINRDPRFNLAYGRYTMPLEHAMTHLPQISKGKNFMQCGEQFRDLIFGEWYLECDFSKYESTQRYILLKIVELGLFFLLLDPEFSSQSVDVFFKTVLKITKDTNPTVTWEYKLNSLCEKLDKLFEAKMLKAGFTQGGVPFSFFALRGSGDMDTGLFNTLLTWIACCYFERVNGLTGRRFCCNGDDNIQRMPRGKTTYVDTFSLFGFDPKLILRKDYHDVDYCSGKFIQINKNGDFMYIQNFIKAINNMSIFRKLQFQHCRDTYYHSLGVMYKAIYGSLPLISNFAEYLLRSTVGKHVSTDILRELNPVYQEQFKFGPLEIKWDCTAVVEICMSFGLNFGILQHLCDWLDTSAIVFKPGETKRYRGISTKGQRRDPDFYRKVESVLNI